MNRKVQRTKGRDTSPADNRARRTKNDYGITRREESPRGRVRPWRELWREAEEECYGDEEMPAVRGDML